MKTMLFLVMAVAVFTALTACAQAQVITGTTKGDLESNLSLLNLFGEQPETVKQLYAAAYVVLASDPRATFADVAEDPEVHRLCDENGITHFGGPMLGTVAADGVRVWVRTARPPRLRFSSSRTARRSGMVP